MPNASRKPQASPPNPLRDPLEQARRSGDALYRSAMECCRQHDRAARMAADEETELEHKHVDALVTMCDNCLSEIADAYVQQSANIVAPNEPWLQKATGLWQASREYTRRQASHRSLKVDSGKHGADKLGGMQMEYELAASSLLALRHAADAYRKTRTGLT